MCAAEGTPMAARGSRLQRAHVNDAVSAGRIRGGLTRTAAPPGPWVRSLEFNRVCFKALNGISDRGSYWTVRDLGSSAPPEAKWAPGFGLGGGEDGLFGEAGFT
jgi:hypothetical protein